MSLRTTLGLRADLSFVRSLESQPGPTTSDLSIAVTTAEHADLKRRAALGQLIPPLEAELRTDPAYGGAWMDQAAGGVFTVAFTHEPTVAETRALARLLPAGSRERLRVVRFSLAQLQKVQDTVSADLVSKTYPESALFVSTGIDPVKNRVEVTVLRSSPAGTEKILEQRYGPMVVILRGDPLRAF